MKNKPSFAVARRISRIEFTLVNTRLLGKRGYLQAHAIVSQIIELCESKLTSGRLTRASLLGKVDTSSLVQAYEEATHIVALISPEGGSPRTQLQVTFYVGENGLGQIFGVVFSIEPWGHIRCVVNVGKAQAPLKGVRESMLD